MNFHQKATNYWSSFNFIKRNLSLKIKSYLVTFLTMMYGTSQLMAYAILKTQTTQNLKRD